MNKQNLDWICVKFRIEYILLCLTCYVINRSSVICLYQFIKCYELSVLLQSSCYDFMVIPRTRINYYEER